MKNQCFIVILICSFFFSFLGADEKIVSKITFTGLPTTVEVDKEPLMKELLNREGGKYNEGFLILDCGSIVKCLQEAAYLDATVLPTTVGDKEMSIEYVASVGKIYHFGKIEVEGVSAADIAEMKKKSGIVDGEKTPLVKEVKNLLISEVNNLGIKKHKKYALNTVPHVDRSVQDYVFVFKEE